MPLGFGPGHIVLDGDPASPKRGTAPPVFGLCLLWPNDWMDQDISGTEVDHGPDHIVLDGDPAPPPKKGHDTPLFGPCLLRPNGWMDQDATWY